MKNLILVAFALAALASAACHERKTVEAAPDYSGSQSASERAHKALDKETGGD